MARQTVHAIEYDPQTNRFYLMSTDQDEPDVLHEILMTGWQFDMFMDAVIDVSGRIQEMLS